MKVIKKLSVCLVLILVASLFFACSPRRQGQTSFTYDELMENLRAKLNEALLFAYLIIKCLWKPDFSMKL